MGCIENRVSVCNSIRACSTGPNNFIGEGIMPKVSSFIFLFSFCVLSGSYAMAGEPAASLSWDLFKESCLHPEQFHHQTPPSNIKIQCTDIQREFLATSPGEVPLPGNRKIIYSVFSNKYNVNAEHREDPILNKVGSCLKFKEVERTITIERALSCEDVLGIKSDLGSYCASNLSLAKGASPKLVASRDTGRRIDTCAGSLSVKE